MACGSNFPGAEADPSLHSCASARKGLMFCSGLAGFRDCYQGFKVFEGVLMSFAGSMYWVLWSLLVKG